MKRILLLILLALLPLSLLAQSSQHDALVTDLSENPQRVFINTDPYEYIPGPQTPAPKGYKPFYISHYGRHGARSNSNKKGAYEKVAARYHKAHDAGLLTPAGIAAMRQIDTIIVLHNNMDGRLTPLGAQEHRQIAHRMYSNYKDVFKKGNKKVVARSSYVPRVLVSMAAFTGELLSLQGDLDMSWDTGEELMKVISNDDTKEVKDSVYRYVNRMYAAHRFDKADFVCKVFTDTAAARGVVGSITRLMKDTQRMASTCPAFGLDNRLLDLFTPEDQVFFEQQKAVSIYMRQCNSVEFGDERMQRTELLFRDFLEKADEAVATGSVAADLRFGHDWPLLAISSRLGLAGVAERRTFETCVDWPGWRYTPFAGNLQLIFYRGRKGDVLVKVLLNERETAILGLEGFPYYKWEDVRALWWSYLQ